MPDLACRYFSDSFWRYVSSLHNGTIYRKHPTTALQERGQWDITEEVWWIMCNPVGDRANWPPLSKAETGKPAELLRS